MDKLFFVLMGFLFGVVSLILFGVSLAGVDVGCVSLWVFCMLAGVVCFNCYEIKRLKEEVG